MKLRPALGICGLCCWLAVPVAAAADDHANASVRGSKASMERQYQVARRAEYSFLRTSTDIRRTVDEGRFVPVTGNEDYELANVSYPFALPEVRLFVQRLGAEYRQTCGEPLVVTSLARPKSRQPRNASRLSVHPAGMAVDLRVPRRSECLTWLESRLLELEAADLLDVTRERRPPHYHVALFPASYRAHVEADLAAEHAALEAARRDSIAAAEAAQAAHNVPRPVLAAAHASGGYRWLLASIAALPVMLFAAWQRRGRKQRS